MPDRHAERVQRHLGTVPMLRMPENFWQVLVSVIRTCARKGNPVGTVDALIWVIALEHAARVVSFEHGFLPLQKYCGIDFGTSIPPNMTPSTPENPQCIP